MFESKLIKTDVTAVKILPNYTLIGIGNFLHVYTRQQNVCLKRIQIFAGHTIHGIEINSLNHNILLFGGNNLHILNSNFNSLSSKKIDDWILAGKWSQFDLTVKRVQVCSKKSIIYSAFIYEKLDQLIIFSGTVFGEIVIWESPTNQVLATLTGHKGVIFSVYFDSITSHICSSSDDRTTLLWSVLDNSLSASKIILKNKFCGHQSRVFRSLIYNKYLVTAGEDSFVNIWDFDGKLIRKIDSHQGGPIWSLHCYEEQIITGGGDGGAVLIPLNYHLNIKQLAMHDGEIPKRIGILNSTNLVCISERGKLWYYVNSTEKWIFVNTHVELQSYNLLEISKCRNLTSLSGYLGDIFIYKENDNVLELMTRFKCENETRIFSFHWLSCKTFMICQKNELILCLFSNRECKKIYKFTLPPFKDNWSTTACQGEKGTYLVGDRKGHVYIFLLGQNNPTQVIKKAHNHLGVTQIYSLSKQIITLGRNSVIRTFTSDSHTIIQTITDKTPFTWLAAMQDKIILAFSGNNFILWDYVNRRIIFEYDCSGGHRSWDFYEKHNETSFIYVKDRVLNIVKYQQNDTYPLNIISGFHASTINGLKALYFGPFYLLVSGGEDTTLRITSINNTNSFSILQILKSHLSSIRAICIWPLSTNSYLIFSGGGRGQIISWLLTINHDDVKNTKCREEHSFYENISSDEESEVRIMDIQVAVIQNVLTLFAATSEGNIKVFLVIEMNNQKFELSLKYTLCYKLRCVTKVCIFQNQYLDILVSFSTDGSAAFWNLQVEGTTPIAIFPLHQSGINAISFHFIDSHTVVLLSGGDDACIKLTKFKFTDTTVDETVIFEDIQQHCAQITGLFLNDKYFLTTSIDQKLLVFRWRIENEMGKCDLMGKYASAVADIQGMHCHDDELKFSVFLYGKGFEFVTINKF